MIHPNIRREIAERYHRALPEDIRMYLKGRGIPATFIERHVLGWNGERIVIPIFGRKREVIGFRYAKIREDGTDTEVISELGLEPELYGWETLARAPQRVVICEGEFDRLVLEANGFPAVASTGGAGTFLKEWLPEFAEIKQVYVCFKRDLHAAAAAKKVQRLLPRARIATLPSDVGHKGTVSDFFAALGRTRVDFEVLLSAASGVPADTPRDQPPVTRELRPLHKSVKRQIENVKRAVRLHDVVSNYVDLQAAGTHLVGHCPFHDVNSRSFSVYPELDVYQCRECGAEGDVVKFVMDKESMTVGQALNALERFRYSHELFGTS